MIDIKPVDEEFEVFTMKRTALIMGFIMSAVLLSAGDLAVLENMGFSLDGRYFMFGQHVLISDSGQAYAEIGIVNVSQNKFVSGGWQKGSWDVQMIPNQDSRGALYELLGKMMNTKSRYDINHLAQGRMLYTKSVDDEESRDTEDGGGPLTLSFRDFERGREYILELYQNSQRTGDDVSSSFYIRVTVENSAGAIATYNVGRSSFMRPGISSYSIARVWVGPKGKSLIIAVAKESIDLSIRYMVETLVIN